MDVRESLQQLLPEDIFAVLAREITEWETVTELRFRIGRPMIWRQAGHWVEAKGSPEFATLVTEQKLQLLLSCCCRHSLYAYQEQLAKGFLSVRGGHRVGICGEYQMEAGGTALIRNPGSMNLRIAHERIGCSEPLLPFLFEDGRFCNTLLLSGPGGGKTTLLRDLCRCLSDQYGFSVSIADERSELAACVCGVPQLQVGKHTDVMDGGQKRKTIPMLLRSMGPQILAMDEIDGDEEAFWLRTAAAWGVGLLASIHGTIHSGICQRYQLEELFPRMICPGFRNGQWSYQIYHSSGMLLYQSEDREVRSFEMGRCCFDHDGCCLSGKTAVCAEEGIHSLP